LIALFRSLRGRVFGSLFLRTRAGQYIFEWAIPLVAGVLVKLFFSSPQANHGGPRPGPYRGIVHGDFVADFIRRDAGEALGQVKVFR
jgi:hypothetical protein